MVVLVKDKPGIAGGMKVTEMRLYLANACTGDPDDEENRRGSFFPCTPAVRYTFKTPERRV